MHQPHPGDTSTGAAPAAHAAHAGDTGTGPNADTPPPDPGDHTPSGSDDSGTWQDDRHDPDLDGRSHDSAIRYDQVEQSTLADRIAEGIDPLHSGAQSGDGWIRILDDSTTPKDINYGEALGISGTSTYPERTPMNSDTFALVHDPGAPYGRLSDETPMTQRDYDSRFVFENGNDNYPPNAGSSRGTRIAYDDYSALQRDYGTELNRIGFDGGSYLSVSVDGNPATFEQRSLPVSSLAKPTTSYELTGNLPPGWTIEVSEIAPAFGRNGKGIQIRFLNSLGNAVPVKSLRKIGLLLP